MLYALLSWKAALGAAVDRNAGALLGHSAAEQAAFDRMMAQGPRGVRSAPDA